ncbi:glycosyltransferase [[Clostridium] leptum]|nr:glycosyltransferase [[Clostridium] leptum]
MVKMAFFHDHPMIRDEEGNHYALNLPYTLWRDRYLPCFDRITVVCRLKDSSTMTPAQKKGYSRADGPHVTIRPAVAYHSPPDAVTHHKEIVQHIREILSEADCAVIRMPSVIGALACREAIRMGKPWALEEVACAWDSLWNYGRLSGKLFAPVLFLINRHYAKKAPRVVYVTQNFLQGRYPSRGIQTGVSNVFINAPGPEVLEKRLKRIQNGPSPLQFGLMGSLDVKFKGHETALKALGSIKDKIPPFQLRFLGGGDPQQWKPLVQSLGLSDRVIFCGTLPAGEAVLNWMDETDIFLCPSLQEGLPRGLVEAMSRGCPSLGAVTGGIPELLGDAYLHSKKDWRKLAGQIVRLTQHPEEMQQCARDNFAVASTFSKEVLDQKRFAFWKAYAQEVEQSLAK